MKLRKLLVIVCVCTLVLGLFGLNAYAENGTEYQNVVPAEAVENKALSLQVGSDTVTDENGTVITASNETVGWRYDQTINTLTLNNCHLGPSGSYLGIEFYGGDLIIKLEGSNSLQSYFSNGDPAPAIYFGDSSHRDSSLYIVGPGTLNISGQIGPDLAKMVSISGGATVNAAAITGSRYGDVSIVESTVTANGPGERTIDAGGSVTIEKSKITVTESDVGIWANTSIIIKESECYITGGFEAICVGDSAADGFHCTDSKLYLNGTMGICSYKYDINIANSLVSINAEDQGIYTGNYNTCLTVTDSQILTASKNSIKNSVYNEDITNSLYLDNGTATLEGDAVLKADAALPAETELTIPEGASLTVPAGMTLSVPGGIVSSGALTVDGTLELPETMTKDQVLALGITGEGELKAGNIYISPSGDCITHNFLEDVCDCGAVSLTAFTNITLRTYITENFDTDMDGALSPEEIANVTEISNEDLRVTTLAGITYLTNLEILYLNGTALTDTALDFSMLSRLYLLDLSGADKLESLDVSGCTELTDLILDHCSSLAALDLSNNLQLHGLKVYNTYDLTSLDLSVHKNLEYIFLDDSNLKSLKLHPDADVEIWGETAYYMQHCGEGYVDLGSIVSDLSQVVKVDYGTLGEDGWVKLDAGKTYFIYYTESGNANAPLPHGVSIYTPADNAHIFIDQIVSKDETGHYVQSCAICRTGNEESAVEAHKYYSLPERNEIHHWQYCDDCGYERREEHIFSADCDESCNYCLAGPVFPEEMHNIIDYKEVEDTGYHQGYCTECRDHVYYRHTYEFACSESCKHCGTVNPDAAAHTEQYVAHGNGTHDKFCSVCGIAFESDAPCVYGEYTDDSYFAAPATCISGATYYKSCACGQKSTETFAVGEPDPTTHDWNTTDVCSVCSAVKISEKTFPDANFRNFISGEFFYPLNEDEIFTLDELLMVKRIAIDVDYICDLTGIAYFTELTTLECHGFQCLKPVDLSQNTKLTEVDFGLQLWHITIAPDATFDLNTLGIDVSKLTLPEGCTVNNGVIKFEAGVYDLSGLTYPSGYKDVLFDVVIVVENPHTHASVETFDDCSKEEVCLCGDITKAAAEHNFTGAYLSDAEGHWHKCAECDATDEKLAHTPNADGDCTTDDLCSVCGAVVVAANESHSGGNATCTEKAVCEVCGTAYGELAEHSYGEDGKCVCGAEKPADGEPPADTEKEPGFFAQLWNAIVWLFWLVVNFFAALFGIAKA